MAKATNRSHYAPVIDQWSKSPVKLGPVPSEQHFTIAHAFAPRGAGKQSLGFAMALRDGGMTRDQMLFAANLYDVAMGKPAPKGTTCLNQFKVPTACGELSGGNQAGVIKYTLTPKGQARLDRASSLKGAGVATDEAKPVKASAPKAPKAKRASKPRKVTEVVITEVSEPVQVPVMIDGAGSEPVIETVN